MEGGEGREGEGEGRREVKGERGGREKGREGEGREGEGREGEGEGEWREEGEE